MDDTSIILIITIGTGFLGLIVRYCFKSKCRTINLGYGLILVNRDVEQEEKAEPNDVSTKV